MEVSVRLFATFRQEAGWAEKTVEVPDGATIQDLLAVLEAQAGIRLLGRPVYAAVNEEYTQADRELHAGDEVALFPPVSGGVGAQGTMAPPQPVRTARRAADGNGRTSPPPRRRLPGEQWNSND